jgi:flagellar biosynthesis protein FlhA
VNKKPGLLNTLRTYSEWVIPTGAVALVFVMLVPLPSIVLDLLLTLSITASVLVLLTAIQILRPVEFSVFPSLILLLTLMRLALDLASTRRILLHGSEGTSAAGKVIEAFGQFVVGGNYIVGFVIFIALIAIQYLVVSHGAVRTAEVTARFTLDAMPGKQMAIDSDLNTGLINADQARARRERWRAKPSSADRWTARRGSAKEIRWPRFLSPRSILLRDFLSACFSRECHFQEALKTYTILTVGDGLVAIIPSLLVSWPAASWLRARRRIIPWALTSASRCSGLRASVVDCQRMPVFCLWR